MGAKSQGVKEVAGIERICAEDDQRSFNEECVSPSSDWVNKVDQSWNCWRETKRVEDKEGKETREIVELGVCVLEGKGMVTIKSTEIEASLTGFATSAGDAEENKRSGKIRTHYLRNSLHIYHNSRHRQSSSFPLFPPTAGFRMMKLLVTFAITTLRWKREDRNTANFASYRISRIPSTISQSDDGNAVLVVPHSRKTSNSDKKGID